MQHPADVSPGLFPGVTSLFTFLPPFFLLFFYSQIFSGQTNPAGNACLRRTSGDTALPKLTSNTKQQLLFHGCVQAETGHLHWVTGLLAVCPPLCVFPRATHNLFSAQYKILSFIFFASVAVEFDTFNNICNFRGGRIREEEYLLVTVCKKKKNRGISWN